jgi:basic amino acid/polyamine antiporter, APA family
LDLCCSFYRGSFYHNSFDCRQSTFISNFNSLSGSNYTGVVQAGQTEAGVYNGVPPVFTWTTLYASAASGALGFLGFYNPVYVASEVKQARKSMIFSQLGALVIFAIFGFIVAAVEYYGEGPAFANSMAALWNAGSSSFPYIAAPLASGMSMFWTQNPILIAMFNLGYAATIFFFNIATLFAFARNLFPWSLDRVTPTMFADVNERTHTPIKATKVMMIAALIYVYISVFQFGILSSYFSFSTAGTFNATIVIAIVAIVYPSRRKDLFDNSDPITRRKIGGLPLISLFGFLTLISSVAIIYAVIYPVLSGNFLTILFEGILPTFIIGAIIFGIATTIRRSKGIDLSLVAREIPPE